MADEHKAAEKQPDNAAEPKKKPKKIVLLAAIGGLMAAEGVGVYFATNFFAGGPSETEGAELDEEPGEATDEHGAAEESHAEPAHGGEAEGGGHGSDSGGDHSGSAEHGKEGEHGSAPAGEAKPLSTVAEISLPELDAFNNRTGRLYLYRIQVVLVTSQENKAKLEQLIEERGAAIRDRINRLIRGADPAQLDEPELEIIRRQIKSELQKTLGDDSLVLEVLIPQLLQSRAAS